MIQLMRAHRETLWAMAAAFAIAAQLSACGASGSGTDPTGSLSSHPDSGIRGRVLLGPTCPVQRIGQPCVRPYQATITIRNQATGKLVARVRSSTNGRFRLPLAPGDYLLVPQTGRPYPREGLTTNHHREPPPLHERGHQLRQRDSLKRTVTNKSA
jgi:hypothetical protein